MKVDLSDHELALISLALGLAAGATPELISIEEARMLGQKLLIPSKANERKEVLLALSRLKQQ